MMDKKNVTTSVPPEESDARSLRSGRSRAFARPAARSADGSLARLFKNSEESGKHAHARQSPRRSPRRRSSSGKSSKGKKHEHHRHYERADRKLSSELSKKCWGVGFKIEAQKCTKPPFKWQEGNYKQDECGSGMVPYTRNFHTGRSVWCKTPLTVYQATHGDLGRQIICREKCIKRDIRPAPPCNMCTSILPLCGGFYRKYECVRPCEEAYATRDERGRKDYRDIMKRYWDPCVDESDRASHDVNTFAHHNVALGIKMKRRLEDQSCW